MDVTTAFVLSHEPERDRAVNNKSISIIALTLTRSLGRRNIRVVRIHPNHLDYSLSSRYCDAVEICPDLYESEEALTSFLAGLATKYDGRKVLIPASDDCSLYLGKHATELESSYTIVNPDAATMERIKDKKLQYELAREAGVPIPETYFPENIGDTLELSSRLSDFPYIIKPLEAQKWRLQQFSAVSGGMKAIVVNDRQELLKEYERISLLDKNIMIQEIIPGIDANLITFLGYCSKERGPIAYCLRSKLRQNPVDFGYCTATVSCHNDEVEAYAKRLLEKSGFHGIVGIEFKFDVRTKSFKLIEINSRPVNTTGLAIGCGVDLPFIAFSDAIGKSVEPVTDWQDGVVWIRLVHDLISARVLRRRGELTYYGWWKSIAGKRVHAVLAFDDLRPFLLHYGRFFKTTLTQRLASLANTHVIGRSRSALRRIAAVLR